jgi:hypothetical protein
LLVTIGLRIFCLFFGHKRLRDSKLEVKLPQRAQHAQRGCMLQHQRKLALL